MQKTVNPADFATAIEVGEIIHKGGYHQCRNCSCRKTTGKGAYRDVSVRLPDSRIIHYYHQHPIVVEMNGVMVVSNCGYKTIATKARLNRYLPKGFRVFQKDFEWYLSIPEDSGLNAAGKTVEWKNGMVIPN